MDEHRVQEVMDAALAAAASSNTQHPRRPETVANSASAAAAVQHALADSVAPQLEQSDDASLGLLEAAATRHPPGPLGTSVSAAPSAGADGHAAGDDAGATASGSGGGCQTVAEDPAGLGPLLEARLPHDSVYGGADPGKHSVDVRELAARAPVEGA